MSEKRMLIIDAEVARKVDENRGDMNRSDFINFLINSCLKEDSGTQNYITKEEFKEFQQGTRDLLRNFLEHQTLKSCHQARYKYKRFHYCQLHIVRTLPILPLKQI